jgi:hypothetical protein
MIDNLTAIDLQLAGLSQRTPYAIHNVSHGQLSIARHYGGCTFQGDHYTYIHADDELVRGDVLAHIKQEEYKQRQAAKEAGRIEAAQAQEGLL